MDYAFEYVADKGIEAENAYPYRAKTGLCKYHKEKVLFSNKAYEDVPQGNNDALLAAVAQQPVSIGIEADTSNFQLYAGGVSMMPVVEQI
jgi:KDEL-tailed cysteine endopeptidase